MAVVNHLKNADAARKFLTVALGRQAVKGYPCWSSVSGVAPNHQITAYNALGEGEWDGCDGAYYKGIWIPPADYNFHTGALATGMTSGAQQVDSFFPKDVPHSRTAAIGYKVPQGIGNADNEANPPLDFEGIFRTKKCPNYNSSGVQTDFSYSANPARGIVELLRTYARLPNLPSHYASAAAYWLSRIDFGAWVDFRDFHDQTEIVDYTTIEDFEGFGLTSEWYSGTNFQTFLTKFVHPSINFSLSTAVPFGGLTLSSLSARFEGFITFPTTENWTLHLTVDNGVKVWVVPVGSAYGSPLINQWDDTGTHTPGTHTATFAATADTFYKIKIEWNDGGAPQQLKFEWSSASQTQTVVPSKYLYPKAEAQNLYESHVYFESPIHPSAAIRQILLVSNSIMQDVNGKLRFFCLEQLTPGFPLDNSNIDSLNFRRRDILQSNPITAYEGDFKDLDSQFLEEPAKAIQIETDYLTRKSTENIKVINLYNTTRWRARKVLQTRMKLEVGNDMLVEIEAKLAKTYPILAGDLIPVTHRKIGEESRNYLVIKAVDKGVQESTRTQTTEPEGRSFILQEWNEDSGTR